MKLEIQFEPDLAGVNKILTAFGLRSNVSSLYDVLARYNEPWRFYHNADHMLSVLKNVMADGQSKFDPSQLVCAAIAAIYHDAVYFPGAADNEKRSADMFAHDSKESILSDVEKEQIVSAIMATKEHESSDPVSRVLIDADMNELLTSDFGQLIQMEEKIAAEFQRFGPIDYRDGRTTFLSKWKHINPEIERLIEYVSNRRYKIACIISQAWKWCEELEVAIDRLSMDYDRIILSQVLNEANSDAWKVPKRYQYMFIHPMPMDAKAPILVGPMSMFVLAKADDASAVKLVRDIQSLYPMNIVSVLEPMNREELMAIRPRSIHGVKEAIEAMPENPRNSRDLYDITF